VYKLPTAPPRHVNPGHQAQKIRENKQRQISQSEIYDGQWRRLSKYIRDTNPFCVICQSQGFVTASEVVDHIIPVAIRPDLRLDISNLRSCCSSCHNKVTRNFQLYGINELIVTEEQKKGKPNVQS
jgi:5-methylcytosine-specific restriction endonuclease McrA